MEISWGGGRFLYSVADHGGGHMFLILYARWYARCHECLVPSLKEGGDTCS